MKKIMFSVLAATGLLLSGCLQTTEEVTINADGSGNFSTTNDMSAVVGLIKTMGGADSEMDELKVDTVISLVNVADSIQDLSATEKEKVKTGQMKMNVDMKSEKVIFTMNFPFRNISEIPGLNALAGKLMSETMKKQMGGNEDGQDPLGNMPEQSTMDSYFDISYKDGQIKRKLNKDKYAGVGSDEYLNGMKEALQMGLPISTTQVFNLPRPAKKVEGKNVTVSDDKKKVTIKTTLEAFFDDAKELEYEIEY